MRAWHFTSTTHLPVILEAGELRRTESNLEMLRHRAGPDVVWLLDGPELGDAPHGLLGSPVDKTEVRFEVEAPDRWTVPWLSWARAQGIEHEWLDTIVRIGGGDEAARRWLISFAKIKQADWIRIDNVKTGKELWTP